MPQRPRSSSISRQLTAEEQQLDARTSSYLTTQSQMPDSFGSYENQYAWMKKDMEMRQMQGEQLNAENRMASDQGDRRQIAMDDAEGEADMNAARAGLTEVRKLVANGMDYSEATMSVSERLNLGLNDVFGQATDNESRMWKSPEQKLREQNRQTLADIKTEGDTIDAGLLLDKMKQDPEGWKKRSFDLYEAAKVTAGGELVAAKARNASNLLSYHESQQKLSEHAGRVGGDDLDNRVWFTSALKDSGLTVTRPDRLARIYGDKPSMLGMLFNSAWMKEYSSKNPDLNAALNTISMDVPPGKENDEEIFLARQKAEQVIVNAAVAYKPESDKIAKDLKQSDSRVAYAREADKLTEPFNKSVDQIVDNPIDELKPWQTRDDISTFAANQLDRIIALAPSDLDLSSLKKDYMERINKAIYKKDNKDVEASDKQTGSMAVKKIMGELSTKISGRFKRAEELPANPKDEPAKTKAEPAKTEGDRVTQQGQPTMPIPGVSPAAMEWLKANPNDPRASDVRKKLGIQ